MLRCGVVEVPHSIMIAKAYRTLSIIDWPAMRAIGHRLRSRARLLTRLNRA